MTISLRLLSSWALPSVYSSRVSVDSCFKYCGLSVVLSPKDSPSPPKKSRRISEAGKCFMKTQRCMPVTRGCVNRIRIWPPIGVTNAQASWLAQVEDGVHVGRWRSREYRSIARVQGQAAASEPIFQKDEFLKKRVPFPWLHLKHLL